MSKRLRKQIANKLISKLNDAIVQKSPSPTIDAPRERGISFAPELIDLILAGKKTQTRRPFKPENDYTAGDRMWVRERWAKSARGYKLARLNPKARVRWQSPLYMPKLAAKLWLVVEAVRVEPIQSISIDDLRAEGFDESNAIDTFRSIWDSFYADQGLGWKAKPDVVVVMFRVESDWAN
ncbi:MAG TPA: hypothetical protein PK402_12010 [Tepidisphaeraceae bacterium]|nr:hypothetical protein [Tepidisphaeraceae bacterium]